MNLSKSPIKQRISLYLKYKNVSDYEFAKSSGMRGLLETNTGISEASIAAFLVYAKDISIAWLITGQGKMLTGNKEPQPTINYEIDTINIAEELKKLKNEVAELRAIIIRQSEHVVKPTKLKV